MVEVVFIVFIVGGLVGSLAIEVVSMLSLDDDSPIGCDDGAGGSAIEGIKSIVLPP